MHRKYKIRNFFHGIHRLVFWFGCCLNVNELLQSIYCVSSGADIGCPRDFLRRPYLSLSAVPWDFPEFIPLFVLIQLLRRPPAKGPLFRAASLCDMAVHRVWSNTEINTPVYAEIPRDYLKMGNCSFSNYFFPVCWINLHRIAIP